MSFESRLLSARSRAETLMVSTVRIVRAAGREFDSETGTYVTNESEIYAGPARIRFSGSQPQERDAAGERVVDQLPTVSLPIATSGDVRVDDVVIIAANPPDPTTVGTRMRVAGIHAQTHSTARRLPVEVVSRG